MDNICHTLVGAACGEAGLKHRSRLSSATLMIAANLPDLDVAVFATSLPSVAFRRGITHGIAAQVILPPLFALVMWAIARWWSRDSGPPPHLGWLVGLSYVGVLSHVALDFLNNYGIRLLMPFSDRWFYGDTLFIIDPWIWVGLGIGIWLSRRRQSTRPARHAMAVVAVYIVVMLAGARVARQVVLAAWASSNGRPPASLMVGPRPVTPFTRDVIVDTGDRYATGTFTWFPTSVTFNAETIAKNHRARAVDLARHDPDVRGFLVWSRFPVWTLESRPVGTRVTVNDMRFTAIRRFAGRGGFVASTTVP